MVRTVLVSRSQAFSAVRLPKHCLYCTMGIVDDVEVANRFHYCVLQRRWHFSERKRNVDEVGYIWIALILSTDERRKQLMAVGFGHKI